MSLPHSAGGPEDEDSDDESAVGFAVVVSVVDGSVMLELDDSPVPPVASVIVAFVGSVVNVASLVAGAAGEKHAGIHASTAARKAERGVVMDPTLSPLQTVRLALGGPEGNFDTPSREP
jgi:hypothetical protein